MTFVILIVKFLDKNSWSFFFFNVGIHDIQFFPYPLELFHGTSFEIKYEIFIHQTLNRNLKVVFKILRVFLRFIEKAKFKITLRQLISSVVSSNQD